MLLGHEEVGSAGGSLDLHKIGEKVVQRVGHQLFRVERVALCIEEVEYRHRASSIGVRYQLEAARRGTRRLPRELDSREGCARQLHRGANSLVDALSESLALELQALQIDLGLETLGETVASGVQRQRRTDGHRPAGVIVDRKQPARTGQARLRPLTRSPQKLVDAGFESQRRRPVGPLGRLDESLLRLDQRIERGQLG